MLRPVTARVLGSFVLAVAVLDVRLGGFCIADARPGTLPIFGAVTLGVSVVGVAAHALATRAQRLALLVSAALVVAVFREVFAVDVAWAAHHGELVPCAVASAAACLLALGALSWGAPGVAFAGGLGLGAFLGGGPGWPGIVCLCLVCAGMVHAAPDEARWRHAVTMAAAGVAGGLALRGLGMDASFALGGAPPDWHWYPGSFGSRTTRIALEAAVVLACIALGRGRTAGLVAFVLAVGALAFLVARSAMPYASPPGDFVSPHAEHPAWAAPLWAAASLAITPWVVPIARASVGSCPGRHVRITPRWWAARRGPGVRTEQSVTRW